LAKGEQTDTTPLQDGRWIRDELARKRERKARRFDQLRQETVEPVSGLIKEAMHFRRSYLRGLAKFLPESGLVCVA
jgi:hypothetical protein